MDILAKFNLFEGILWVVLSIPLFILPILK